ncbi:hypothetical protein [Cupriavidus campinensis]|uniref:DUF2793 domain-containing protein n=1 Tax=Cupriavidus campinensis TaxID=151783 RepID=A0ABY3ESL6_9BURK|nr:hypothetical protein [Cupriavidus campinensis]TSP13964.1 hypothetical protein FGG12_05695 [Cupriavidus campinensis]
MQKFTYIPADLYLSGSLIEILENDQTALSQSSGTAFPTADLVVGMPCFRTDLRKLYILTAIAPDVWEEFADLGNMPIKGTGGKTFGAGQWRFTAAASNIAGGATFPGSFTAPLIVASQTDGGGNAVGAATLVFERGNAFRVQFGLDTDNRLKVGGLSMGNNAYEIWHKGYQGANTGMDADSVDGMHADRFISGDTNTGTTNIATGGTTAANTPTKSGFYRHNGEGIGGGMLIHLQHPQSQNYAAQLLMGYTENELYFRAKDNGVWKPVKAVWHSGNSDPNSKVAKTGDSMNGSLQAPSFRANKGGVGCGFVFANDVDTGFFAPNGYDTYGTTELWHMIDGSVKMAVRNDGTIYSSYYGNLHDYVWSVANSVAGGRAGTNRNFSWELVWTGNYGGGINLANTWGHGVYYIRGTQGNNGAVVTGGGGTYLTPGQCAVGDAVYAFQWTVYGESQYQAWDNLAAIYKLRKDA